MLQDKIADFIDDIKSINWFQNSGIPNEKYHMVFSLFEACDCWGKQYMEIWEPNICALEDRAAETIGDDEIDHIFVSVSAAVGDTIWDKFGEWITRQHLEEEMGVCYELFDMVKRDIAWACIEKVLDKPGLFMTLLDIYREGYFPCSWIGEYPFGKVVVL